MGVREYDPERDAVKPAVKEVVKPAVLPAVQPPEPLQDAPGREIVPDAKPSPSQEPKPEPRLIMDKEGSHNLAKPKIETFKHIETLANDLDIKLEKGTPKTDFINKVLELGKHGLAMILYFGCGLVVGWMACMVVGQAIA